MINNKKISFSLLISIPCVFAFGLFLPMSRSIIWGILYLFTVYIIYRASVIKSERKVNVSSLILGLLFAGFTAIGYELEHNGRVVFYGMIVIQTIGLAVILFSGLKLLFIFILRLDERHWITVQKQVLPVKKPITYTITATVLILICWLPYLLAFYPGTMSSDALGEIRQQLGMSPLSNHHPIIHQLFIKFCLIIGGKSVENGVAVHTCLQMINFAVAFGSMVTFIRKRSVSCIPALAVFCFCAFFPVNPLYAIMMEKGSSLAVVSVALILSLMKEAEEQNPSTVRFWGIVILSFLFCTLRNNGLYAFIIGFSVCILYYKTNRKRLFLIMGSVIILIAAYRFFIFDIAGVQKSRSGEALSVPIQQIARVARDCPEELDSEEFETLKEVFSDISALGTLYDPTCSDPVKSPSVFDSVAFGKEKGKYIQCWMKIGFRHVRTYLDAFLMQNYGYWYTDTNEPSVSYSIYEPNDFGLTNNRRFESFRVKLMNFVDIIQYRSPFSILFSIGFSFWLLIFTIVVLFIRGNGKYAAPLFLLAGLWLTTLASPLYCSYRYLYPMVAVPNLFFVENID